MLVDLRKQLNLFFKLTRKLREFGFRTILSKINERKQYTIIIKAKILHIFLEDYDKVFRNIFIHPNNFEAKFFLYDPKLNF